MRGKPQFKILAKAKIKTQRSAIISKHLGNNGYTIAQQIDLREDNRTVPIFIKGAFHVESLDGLYELRDALNESIRIEENEKDLQK